MTPEPLHFPEYGDGGDYVGAQRSRRAFRFFVLTVVAFTGLLAFSELYLQYEGAERLYMLALTKHPESARVFLQQAVRRDEQTHEAPTPKYLMALAAREEKDRILPTYERAFSLDPQNPALAIRYGCELAQAGEYEAAAEKFRVAAAADPANALPLYLAASVHPFAVEGEEGLSESLTSVAVANNSDKLVVYPKPLWFSSLPQRGRAYARLCRELVDQCSRPISRYVNHVVGLAQRDIDRGRIVYWDSWLQTLQEMGERIVRSARAPQRDGSVSWPGAAREAALGIDVQLHALEQRLRISRARGGPGNPEFEARRTALEAARDRLYDFENGAPDRMALDERGYAFPLRLLVKTVLVLSAVYLALRIVWGVLRRRRMGRAPIDTEAAAVESEEAAPDKVPASRRPAPAMEPERTVRHPWLGKTVLFAGAVLLLITLFVVFALQRSGVAETAWIPPLTLVWWFEVTALLCFGLAYPFLTLARPRQVAERNAAREDLDEAWAAARRRYRYAALCFMSRYYGILLGSLWVVVSLWIVGYRMAAGLYPWQLSLLTSGLIEEEMEAVRQALSLLG